MGVTRGGSWFGRGVALLTCILACVSLTGCEETIFEIVLVPHGERLKRQLTAWVEDGSVQKPIPDEERERLAAVYGHSPRLMDENTFRFEGTYSDRMPDDVGNWGVYRCWTTSLGSTMFYMERFRGTKDLAATLTEVRERVDTVVVLLRDWLENELGEVPGFARLREFVDVEFRADMQYVALDDLVRTYVEGRERSGEEGERLVIILAQHLMERGYLDPDEWLYLIQSGDIWDTEEGADQIAAWFVKLLTKKLGLPKDQPLPQALAAMSTMRALADSLESYTSTTPGYLAYAAARWDRGEEADVETYLEEGMWREEPEDDGSKEAHTEVASVSLRAMAEPIMTNGVWDEAARQISWPRRLLPLRETTAESPVVYTAYWSEPDGVVQKGLFGQVLLHDEDLARYCFWRASLPVPVGRAWDKFVTRLRMGIPEQEWEAILMECDPLAEVWQSDQKKMLQRGVDLLVSELVADEPEGETNAGGL